jgi:hypothetical protein
MTDLTYTDADGTVHDIRTSDDWKNYGDVHPQDWGGLFVRWTGRFWDIVETHPPADLPDGLSETEHMIEQAAVYPDDLFIDGDPDQGPTEDLQRPIEALHGTDSYEQAVIETPIGYYAAEYIRYYGGHSTDWVDDAEYQTWLDDMEIDV